MADGVAESDVEVRLAPSGRAPEATTAAARVVGLFEDARLAPPALHALVERGEARATPACVAVTHEAIATGGSRPVLIVGLGARTEFDAERARAAAAVAAKRARELGARSLS